MMNRFPPGYRFHPTDTELVGYLFKKTMGIKPLPCEGFVSECDLYGEKEPPEMFEGTREKFHYVFTRLKKQKKTGSRFERTVGKGTWKGVDSSLPVFDLRGNVVGNKRNLVYLTRDKVKGGWNMVEYRLDNVTQKYANERGKDTNYVICRIKKKKNKSPRSGQNMQQATAATQVEQTLTQQPERTVLEPNAVFSVEENRIGILDHMSNIIPEAITLPRPAAPPETLMDIVMGYNSNNINNTTTAERDMMMQPPADAFEMGETRPAVVTEPAMGEMAENGINIDLDMDWDLAEFDIDELRRILDS